MKCHDHNRIVNVFKSAIYCFSLCISLSRLFVWAKSAACTFNSGEMIANMHLSTTDEVKVAITMPSALPLRQVKRSTFSVFEYVCGIDRNRSRSNNQRQVCDIALKNASVCAFIRYRYIFSELSSATELATE